MTDDARKIVERAVRMEESSCQLYRSAAGRVKDPGARTALQELAREEERHREKLAGMLRGNLEWAVSLGRRGAIRSAGIGDALEAKPIAPGSTLEDVLAFAIKREAATGDFYAQMAALLDAGPERDTFEMLAREESRHKATLEDLFERDIYQDD